MTYYFTGKRKKAQALLKAVHYKIGHEGAITINNQPGAVYFQNNPQLFFFIQKPFLLLGIKNPHIYDISVSGGGLKGQAQSIQLAICKDLYAQKKTFKDSRYKLRKEGLLTRDSRSKERKKYGLKKSRKASQFSKR